MVKIFPHHVSGGVKLKKDSIFLLVDQFIKDLLFSFKIDYFTLFHLFIFCVPSSKCIPGFEKNQAKDNPWHLSSEWCTGPVTIFSVERHWNESEPLTKGLIVISVGQKLKFKFVIQFAMVIFLIPYLSVKIASNLCSVHEIFFCRQIRIKLLLKICSAFNQGGLFYVPSELIVSFPYY